LQSTFQTDRKVQICVGLIPEYESFCRDLYPLKQPSLDTAMFRKLDDISSVEVERVGRPEHMDVLVA
jgi:hypothetical protein